MKILVVGLGSMGRRRIRLLLKINHNFEIVGIDSQESRCRQAEEEFGIRTMNDINEALETMNPQCVVISTSPLSHAGIIKICLEKDCHVFTELNLVADGYDENIQLAKEHQKVLFLSSTFLYRAEIQYIQQKINENKEVLNYNYHVGQYLPDWHPWESINNYFVGEKRTNGCRELLAIELPWLIKSFGLIKNVQVVSRKSTNLPLRYKDNYLLLIEHENGNAGTLAVDVMSRKAVRRLEVFGESLYLTWDGTPATLKEYNIDKRCEESVQLYSSVNMQEGYASFIVENAYEDELRTFLNEVDGKGVAKYSFEEDRRVLKIIDSIEEKN